MEGVNGPGFSAVGRLPCGSAERVSVGVEAVIRLVRGLLGFAVGVLIAWVWLVPDARAETIAATLNPPSPVARYLAPGDAWPGADGGYAAAQSRALAYYAAAGATGWQYGAGWNASPPAEPWSGAASGVYPFTLRQSPTVMGNGGSGWSYNLTKNWVCVAGNIQGSYPSWTCSAGAGTYSCPANQNWTLQGNQCVRADCPMGYRKADGTCDPCPAGKYAVRELAGHLGADDTAPRWGSPFELSLSGTGASVPSSVCHQGCTLDLAGGDLNFAGSGGPSGQWSWLGAPKFSGATCSASAADPAPVQPNSPEAACVAAGQGYGTVNGTVVCVPQVDTKRREVKEVTGPAGGKTVTIENQVCTGGSCTSTTTVTHSGGGAAGGQVDGSSTSSSVGGSSTQGDGSSACDENPYSAACLGNGATQEGLGQGDGGGGISSISPVSLPGSAVCPADLQLPHGVTLPFRHACEFAVLVRPFVLILGWLSAGFFVVGGLRSG